MVDFKIYNNRKLARWRSLQNVKKKCEFKLLKEATVNWYWLPYLMFQTCFMISKALQNEGVVENTKYSFSLFSMDNSVILKAV